MAAHTKPKNKLQLQVEFSSQPGARCLYKPSKSDDPPLELAWAVTARDDRADYVLGELLPGLGVRTLQVVGLPRGKCTSGVVHPDEEGVVVLTRLRPHRIKGGADVKAADIQPSGRTQAG